MGRIITVNVETGSLPSVLTEAGAGGVLSPGYLCEKPAEAYLADDETPVFVLTSRKRGVELGHEGERNRIRPGSGYRAISVVTDRRLVVLVGDSTAPSVDGDQCLSTELVDIESVSVDEKRRTARLTVQRSSGKPLVIHSARTGLEAVANYVTAASQAWIHVENRVDQIERRLVDATDQRDEGEHDEALETAREAYEALADPRQTATQFDAEWPGSSMVRRVDAVRDRCVGTLAAIRLERARRFVDDAETNWRDDRFEAAHDAFERAREEFETILSYDDACVENRDEVRTEADQVEGALEELQQSPLRRAVEADRAAADADDPGTAAAKWETALDHYRTVMEIDWGADERRFAGDPSEIRDRLADVVERLISARRSTATKAKRAGDWYVGAEQYDIAIEEFEEAREQYEQALDVARERYPDAVDHLTVERDALVERIERVKATRRGEDVGPAETGGADDSEPEYDVEATIGSDDLDAEDGDVENEDAENGDADDSLLDENAGRESDGADEEPGIEEGLRELDAGAFIDVVESVLAETGWTLTRAAPEDSYDLEATKETPAEERMLVSVVHRPHGDDVDTPVVEECASLRREHPDADAIMVATSASVTNEATRHARREQVRLHDDECLSAVIESRNLEGLLETHRVEVD